MTKKKAETAGYPELIYVDHWLDEDETEEGYDGEWLVYRTPEEALDPDDLFKDDVTIGVYKLVKLVKVATEKKVSVKDVK